ncbi:hypothetical protein CYLTODRAFT_447209 [Cylindrobasidium torrendii FP15055 ss-10]|uniref:FMR1-interacting protein 1 conserved domain-containing protein n=1 Tax=Cylindrobasidium torrendii FP15055 ss-10 TaxID=1314674 RepID=A0A0D7AVM1_9AGAR|nr:hypothetical protein CYLTODRAFT_447209 [Cylindrobasidium torrendii FP15055 ss-10]
MQSGDGAMYNAWAQSYSSHYANAYTPSSSSFNVPNNAGPSRQPPPPPTPAYSGSSSWYQSGNSRCSKHGCNFTGSAKSVEVHMLDRHLIHPPGYDKRKDAGSNWDADPALKGKQVPIMGTNLVLDTPDAIDAWVAERRKRWPSAPRVEDKKRKQEEAQARGQLTSEELGIFSKKRPRIEPVIQESRGRGRGRGQTRGRGLERGRGRGRGRGGSPANPSLPLKPIVDAVSSSSSSDSEDDAEPEVVSSKLVKPIEEEPAPQEEVKPIKPLKPLARPRAPRAPPAPQQPPHTNLLRNLLLPEIRMTVSNLSQAIRFIVDNDFLQNVELKVGEAQDEKIVVVDNSHEPMPEV